MLFNGTEPDTTLGKGSNVQLSRQDFTKTHVFAPEMNFLVFNKAKYIRGNLYKYQLESKLKNQFGLQLKSSPN